MLLKGIIFLSRKFILLVSVTLDCGATGFTIEHRPYVLECNGDGLDALIEHAFLDFRLRGVSAAAPLVLALADLDAFQHDGRVLLHELHDYLVLLLLLLRLGLDSAFDEVGKDDVIGVLDASTLAAL